MAILLTDLTEQILNLLEDICETDVVKENPDVLLFEEGILDSFGAVALLVEIQERLGIEVSISDFDRDEWATPNLIIKKLADMQ